MLNKVILIGRLGRDPELRYMPNGEAVCNFSVATSETWTDRNSGQRQERTEWHNITIYRKLGEIAGQYLKKGSQVYLEGRIQSRKYTDKQGMERTAYDIICSEMKMLDSRNSQQGGAQGYDNAGYQPDYGNAPQQQSYPQQSQQPPAAPQRQASTAPAAPVDDIDDDIPF
ncbi:single-stranded DNA-binding protein [Kingella negevensis]|uniref:Single-stranded DNA-binding protein n=1 Tax=Kingella negevensis TaxID=1522312 RepID=A0A238TEU0_9NEIS|nr:single-stranded DNA-binding protein [Kingella negevensis]MDK4679835.1 single-stranded DNA-binding protein [Kingella negevensis]MDK4682446.1 single-stranded DNA-binding protein [Kingella negevensis]MDK4684662.1 single-stranded DNA-binding protein [Kingella negevensis]MDK4690643.1 single-stranded DNA-binding protein [Kingella negevensis]MDK4692008.1 single-stranded DNA-binding protein [Kingella negevensis]